VDRCCDFDFGCLNDLMGKNSNVIVDVRDYVDSDDFEVVSDLRRSELGEEKLDVCTVSEVSWRQVG